MLKQDEIIQICKNKYDIELTDRNFVFYRNEGFFSVKGRENRFGLYSDDVPKKIVLIRNLQDQGMKLKNIKNRIQDEEEKKSAQKEIEIIEGRRKALEGWSDPKERLRRLVEFLELEESGQIYDVGMIGTHKDETVSFLAVFSGDNVNFYKFRIDLEDNSIEIAEKKHMTKDGVEMVMRLLIRQNLDIGVIMDKDDVFLTIFYR